MAEIGLPVRLKLIISFDEFKNNINSFVKDGHTLLELEIANESDYNTLRINVQEWIKNCESFLSSSFNLSKNQIEQDFYELFPSLQSVSDIKAHLQKAVDNQREIIKTKQIGLLNIVRILSVCDAIIKPDEVDFDVIAKYTVRDKLSLIVVKLLALYDSSYYPIKDILEGNGITMERFSEAWDLIHILEEKGWVQTIGGLGVECYAQLTPEGKMLAEDQIQEKSNVTAQKPPQGRIFISHAIENSEIVSKFCDLILENGLNINTSTEVFNTSYEGTKPKTGEDFRNRIKEELLNAKVVFQFISTAYKKSEACLNEMGAAWVLSERVKPLIIEKGEYDVGFIHSTTQQVQLHNESDILRLVDELKEEGIIDSYKLEKLSKKVKEFVHWLETNVSQKPLTPAKRHKVKATKNPFYKINSQSSVYYLINDKYCLIPDDLTRFFLKYTKYNKVTYIQIGDSDLQNQLGKPIESILNGEIRLNSLDSSLWLIYNNRRHHIANDETYKHIIRVNKDMPSRQISNEDLNKFLEGDSYDLKGVYA